MPILDIDASQTIDLRHFNDGSRNQKEKGGRKYNLKELKDRHREIIRLSLLGYKQTVIAGMLGCTPTTVCSAINSHLGLQKREELQEKRDASAGDVLVEMKTMLPNVLNIYKEVLIEGTAVDPQRERFAKDLLDRTGYAKVQRIDSVVRHAHLTAEDIASIKAKINARKQLECEVVDDNEHGDVRGLRSFTATDLFARPSSGKDIAGGKESSGDADPISEESSAGVWPTPRVVSQLGGLDRRLTTGS